MHPYVHRRDPQQRADPPLPTRESAPPPQLPPFAQRNIRGEVMREFAEAKRTGR